MADEQGGPARPGRAGESGAVDDGDDLFAELIALANDAVAAGEPSDDGEPVAWEDVLPIARAVFTVWVDGGELAWAEHAWAALTAAGLTSAVTEVDRARVVCRLLALTALYQEFCARAFEEGYRGDRTLDEDDVLGAEPHAIPPFVLGRLAERDGIDADVRVGCEFDEGTPAHALRELARAQYGPVVGVLQERWGRAGLFASLWMSTDSATTYPLTREIVSECVNTDVTAGKLEAWQWIEEGMDPD